MKLHYALINKDECEGAIQVATRSSDDEEAKEEATIAAAEHGCNNALETEMWSVKPHFGLLAKVFCDKELPLQVLMSAAGFYIGTCDDDGPCSRESDYFETRQEAEQALGCGKWRQRTHP